MSEIHILHISKWAEILWIIILEYIINIAANNYDRGAIWCPQDTRARQAPQARPGGWWAAQPSSGTHLLVHEVFWPRKNKERTFRMERHRLEAELGQEHFCPPPEWFRRGNFPPGGGNWNHRHHKQPSHLWEANLHQHLQQHHLLSNPSSSLVFNLCIGTSDWYLWVTSSVDYIL